MTKSVKTILEISFMIVSIIVFSPIAFANVPDDSVNQYDSIYRYNALENKIAFHNSVNTIDNLVTQPPVDNKLPNEPTTNLQDIIEKQNFSIEQVDKAINLLNDRSEIKTFLIGNNLGVLRFQLVQIENQTFMFKALAVRNPDIIEIASQIDLSEKEGTKVENFILKQESEFSLFGWLTRIL